MQEAERKKEEARKERTEGESMRKEGTADQGLDGDVVLEGENSRLWVWGRDQGGRGGPSPRHLEGQQLFHRDVEDDVHVRGAPGRKQQRGV